MAERATVARPYAKAAFGYAREQGRLAEWSGWLATARAVVLSEEFNNGRIRGGRTGSGPACSHPSEKGAPLIHCRFRQGAGIAQAHLRGI